MQLLKSLLQRPSMRHFALLDQNGICRGLRHSRERPAGSCWVEVGECRLAWLQRRLPKEARLG